MQITGVIPQLRTTDLAASIRFYTTKLGLTLEFQYEDSYAAAVAAGLKRNGVPLVKELHETPWETWELTVKDDQGHTLYFGERR